MNTIEEKAWEIIKGMNISGPWQEHLVHKAMVAGMESVKFDWIDIDEKHPEDGQRVLVWNSKYNDSSIQVFNEEYQCWDTEDGDDFEYAIDEVNNVTHDLNIRYWHPLPSLNKPNKK